MRTTLTLDADVAAQIEELRQQGRPFKQLVNEALRAGLGQMGSEELARKGPYTRPAFLGKPLLPNVDDVGEALALVEGDTYR